MSKRSFLRKSAVSVAATLSLGGLGTVATAQIVMPPNFTIGVQTLTPGLVEGRVAGAFNVTDPNPADRGIKLEPIMAQTPGSGNVEPWPDNTTYIYTGQMLIPDNGPTDGIGSFALAEHNDDSTQLKVNGVEVLNNTQWDVPNTTGVLNLPAGWHDVEFRFGEGGGGWGPSNSGGWTDQLGFGVDFTLPIEGNTVQANYTRPVDNGSMNIFRVKTYNTDTSKDNQSVTVNGNATLSVFQGRTVPMGALTVANGTTFTLDSPGGATKFTETNIGATATFSVTGGTGITGPLKSTGAVTNITKTGAGTLDINTRAGSNLTSNPTVDVTGGTLGVAVAGGGVTSIGTGAINLNGGTLALSNDSLTPSGPGVYGTTGQFWADDNVFDPLISQDSTNTFGWSGLDTKALLDSKLAARPVLATVPVNHPINFPRGDANPANGGTNDLGVEAVFNVDGANLGVSLTGNTDFAAKFSGKLNVATAGAYAFTVGSNDGGVLFVDTDTGAGQNWVKVADNNRFSNSGGGAFQERGTGSTTNLLDAANPGPTINQVAATTLAVGQYDYIVGSFNKNADEYGIEVYWTPPGGTKELIPLATGGPINFANSVTVSGISGLRLNTPTTMPNIRLNNNSQLTVAGSPLTLTQVTIDGKAQVNMDGRVNIGAIAPATAGAPWTFIKGGNQSFTAAGPAFAGLPSTNAVGVAAGRLIAVGAKGATPSSIGSAKIVLSGGQFVADSGIVETQGATNTLTEYWYHTNGNIAETSIEPPDGPGGLLRTVPTGSMPLTGSLVQYGDDAGTGDTVMIADRWGRIDQVAAGWFGEWTFSGGAAHTNQYTFSSKSDDGSTIWVDLDNDGRFEGGGARANDGTVPNEMVLDNNFYQGDTTRNGVRTIPDGTYRVFLGWYEGGGGATSSYKFARGNFPAADNAAYDASTNLIPIDPTVTTVVTSRGRSYDLLADTGNGSFQGNAVDVLGGTTTLEAGGGSKFGAMTFTNTATVNARGNKTSIASVTTAAGTGTLNSGLGPNNLSIGDVGASAGATTVINGDNRIVSGALTGAGTVRFDNGVAEFTRNGVSTGTGSLDIRPNATPAAAAAVARFNPGATGTFGAAGVTAITNEGLLHAASGTTDLSSAVVTTTTVLSATGTVAGLMEGRLDGGFNETGPNSATGGIVLNPLKAYDANKPPWGDNETWVYSGQMFFPDNGPADGQSEFALAEHVDDNVLLRIDGVQVLRNTAWDVVTSTGRLTLPAGWHDVDFRFAHGGGGAGPSGAAGNGGANNWTADFGFGVDFTTPIQGDISRDNYIKVEDPGNASVLRFNHPEAGVVRVATGSTLRLGAVRGANSVDIQGTGKLSLHGPMSKIVSGALSIAGTPTVPTATLDVTDSGIILDYPVAGPNPAADVRSRIIVGRGTPGLTGSWDGKGITSSASQAAPDSTSVGYAVNADMPLGAVPTFGGQTVDPTSVLIRHTRGADANLDGVVNDDDVTIVGATYAPGVANASWANGDFDYNGFVDDDDVTLLGALYDPSAAPIPAPQGGGGVAAVPEPATWLMLTLGGLGAGLFGWRRKRQAKQ